MTIIKMEVLSGLGIDGIEWFDSINIAAEKYVINTNRRISTWIGQLMVESGGFKILEENLNYSAKRLLEVFPSHFDDSSVFEYANFPGKIADRVYANRMGNGDEASCDGWHYRGRGLIQLTGKSNYQNATKALGVNFVNNPDLLLDPDNAAMVAAWFFSSHDCNELADNESYVRITELINGGVNGLDDRINWTKKCLSLMV